MFKEAGMPYSFGEKGVRTKYQYKYPKPHPLNNKGSVYAYWALRGISKETIDYADVREDEQGNTAFLYYDTNDVLTMVKYRPSKRIEKGTNKMWCQKDADTTPLLFNMNRINPSAPLLIVEGEGDALAAMEAGYKNVVSVPFGSHNFAFLEICWDYLEQFDQIIIAADADDAGRKLQKECIYRLGSWRTKFIDMPASVVKENGETVRIKDINEVLFHKGKQAVLDLIYNAKASPVESVSDFSDITNVDIDELDGIEFGIKELTKKLLKLFYGSFTIATGINGSGKSSFLSQLLCNSIDTGHPAFLYTGEMANVQAKNWLNFILAGQRNIRKNEFNGSVYYKITNNAQKEINDYYRGKLFIYKDGLTHRADAILQSMEDCARKYGCKLFILDNFTAIDIGANEKDKWIKQEEFVTQLIAFAKKFNVAVMLVVHPRKLEAMRRLSKMDVQGISAIIDLAHRILSLYRIQDDDRKEKAKFKREFTKFHVLIDVLKDRYTGYEGMTVGMYYDRPSRRFYSDLVSLDKSYSWDKEIYATPLPFMPQELF